MRKHWLSQLAHVELLSPRPAETLHFFQDLLGMEVSATRGQSVYLRGWGEFFHHSLKVTEAPQAGLGHAAWRADSSEALSEAVDWVKQSGLGEDWVDEDEGHGAAYRFRTPDGHMTELFWEVGHFEAAPHAESPLRNRPQKYTGKGAAIRRLDHVTLFASDVAPCREFYQDLGFRYHEGLFEDNTEKEIGAWLAVTNLSHDTAFLHDATGSKGRLNHVAFWQDTREEVLRTADIMRDQEIFIEAGPSRHGITESFFFYIYEPGGNRIEIYQGGYLNFAPDWGPIKWYTSQHPGMYWTGDLPPSNYTYGTPVVPE